MKIIVAHPGKQHSYRLASALKKSNDLLCYCTTVYNKHDSAMMKMIKPFLSADNKKRVDSRRNLDLNDSEVVQFCSFGGLIETLLARIDKRKKVFWFIQNLNAISFGKKVAKLAIKQQADAVIMYDTNCYACFNYLKKKAPNIIRIQDVSICTRPYMRKIYQEEIELSGHDDLYIDTSYLWDDKEMEKLQAEIENADYFFSASKFVSKSLDYCGVNSNQILYIPYGANVHSEKKQYKQFNDNAPLRLLFVGQVVYRKGIVNLLESMQAFDAEKIELTITGAYDANAWFVKKYINRSNIHFSGLVTFDKMKDIYMNSDVFILPSFAEGMAQVGIEAMACGLPIVCSTNSGVSDIVEDGKSGFIIDAGSTEQIVNRINWFLNNKHRIKDMGTAAHNTAMRYTWTAYENNIQKAIRIIEDKRGVKNE